MTTTPDPIPALTDPRPALEQAVQLMDSVIEGTRPEHLGRATPCPDWTVRQLLGHIVCVARRITAVGRGEPAMSVPILVDDIDDRDWSSAWHDAASTALAEWADDEQLARLVSPPFGQMPGAAALSIYVSEITVHTWDLATATDQDPRFDEAIVRTCLDGIRGALPATGRTPEMPFTDAVPLAADATAIELLVAFCGRTPASAMAV